MTDHPSIRTASESQLRSWADARVISSAVFVDEMERRRAESRQVITPPPLDYDFDLDLDLDIPLIEAHEQHYGEPLRAQWMFDLAEWLILAGVTLAGAALLAIGLWNWPVSP